MVDPRTIVVRDSTKLVLRVAARESLTLRHALCAEMVERRTVVRQEITRMELRALELHPTRNPAMHVTLLAQLVLEVVLTVRVVL